jgi:FdhE protein
VLACADNQAVTGTTWQNRIRRGKDLAVEHPFAAELLAFYVRLAQFQESLYSQLVHAPVGGFSDPLESAQILSSSKPFLLMVEEYGPARSAEVARRLRSEEIESGWPDLLNATWGSREHVPSEPQDFLARAFLQPLAERVRSRLAAPRNSSSARLCPFCGRRPGAGILRPQGDGALRSLLCSFCLGEWEFRRIFCPNCAEEDNEKLPVYTANDFPQIRVECCDSCKTYIKSLDLTKSGLADPVADEIASAPLDVWAHEHAYRKVHPNVLGL